ncbi:MAG: hypothetical protein ACRDQZ_14550 [Mycobacteriales bacterium]
MEDLLVDLHIVLLLQVALTQMALDVDEIVSVGVRKANITKDPSTDGCAPTLNGSTWIVMFGRWGPASSRFSWPRITRSPPIGRCNTASCWPASPSLLDVLAGLQPANKGLRAMQDDASGTGVEVAERRWEVPYLPIDPRRYDVSVGGFS